MKRIGEKVEGVVDRIVVGDVYCDDQFVWFSNLFYNGLFKYNLESEELCYVTAFPMERVGQFLIHRSVICYDSKLFFFPEQGNNIHVFNLNSYEIEVIPINKFYGESLHKTCRTIVIGDQALLWPGEYGLPLVYFSLKDYTISMFPLETSAVAHFELHHDTLYFSCVRQNENNIYAVIYNTSYVLKYDLHKGTILCIDTKISNLFRVFFIEDKIWVLREKGNKVLVLNQDWSQYCVYQIKGETQSNVRLFNQIQEYKEGVLLLPALGDYIYFIRNKEVTKVESSSFDSMEPNDVMQEKFFQCIEYNQSLFLLPRHYEQVVKISNGRIENIGRILRLTNLERASRSVKILNEALDIGVTIGEERFYTLENFINKIGSMAGRNQYEENVSGDRIFLTVCSL